MSNDVHSVRGVVLPADGVRPGPAVLRVAVTVPRPEGVRPAEIAYLDARRWNVSPMPDAVDRRHLPSRRQTRGPLGLPLYRGEDLPSSALATRTMLQRQHRRRPAQGQKPIAEYYTGYDYTELFAIDDTDAMPALSAARQEQWDRLRRCARCRERALEPFREGGDGRRYCTACHPVAADSWWTDKLAGAQHAALAWARDVAADGNAVVAEVAGWPITRIAVVEVASGTVVHDLTVAAASERDYRQLWRIPADDPRLVTCTPLAQAAELFTTLEHRRIIARTNGLRPIAERLVTAGLLDPVTVRAREAWTTAAGDDPDRWYAYWLSRPSHQNDGRVRWSTSWNKVSGLLGRPWRSLTTDDDVAALVRLCRDDRNLLIEMAAGLPTPERVDRALAETRQSEQGLYVGREDVEKYAAPPPEP